MREEGESVVLGARGKIEKKYGNDAAAALGLIDVLLGLLVLVVPVASDEVTVGAELADLSCQLKDEALFYFLSDSEPTGRNCCGEKIELSAGNFARG